MRDWKRRKNLLASAVCALMIVALLFLPTGFARQIYVNAEGVRVEILRVDNSGVYTSGIISQGDQECTVRILSGTHRGEEVSAINLLVGKKDLDKQFVQGDIAWAVLEQTDDGAVRFVNLVDHNRFPKELVLIAVFAACILLFSGWTGVRTLLSFAFTLLVVWKILIPSMLRGISPMLVALLTGNLITAVTLLMVAGFSKKAYAAIAGSIICSLATCGLTLVFNGYLGVNGAVLQWSESLLYAGYGSLNLTDVFHAGVYLACSGAILDLAIDISAALEEIVAHHPEATRRQLIVSGLRIGKSVVGTQTSTLLLAYMGSYLSVMMVYMAQGTPLMSILNTKTVAAELLHTFVGCIGLTLVSPLTSVFAGCMYGNGRAHKHAQGHASELAGDPVSRVEQTAATRRGRVREGPEIPGNGGEK